MSDAPIGLASTGAALVTDVSARSAAFELSGPGARDVIAAGCDPVLTSPGRVARTRFANLCTVLIVQLDTDRYRVLVDVSIAETFADWLSVTAATGTRHRSNP
jgi:heterotetrameric sarcosine oxidase gamma subunit